MTTITLSREEYKTLKRKAAAYEQIIRLVETDVIAPPPVRSRSVVISELKKTKKYNAAFLKSLDKGLKRSTFFTA